MSRRTRNRRPRGDHYALIPDEVMTSAAYVAQPDYAVRVLLALAVEYRGEGQNNGDLSITRARAKQYGIAQAWKITAGLALLREAGLIVRTREARVRGGRGVCALYGLGWRPLDIVPHAYPPILAPRRTPNSWETWTVPDDWTEHVRDVQRAAQGKSVGTHGGTESVHTVVPIAHLHRYTRWVTL